MSTVYDECVFESGRGEGLLRGSNRLKLPRESITDNELRKGTMMVVASAARIRQKPGRLRSSLLDLDCVSSPPAHAKRNECQSPCAEIS